MLNLKEIEYCTAYRNRGAVLMSNRGRAAAANAPRERQKPPKIRRRGGVFSGCRAERPATVVTQVMECCPRSGKGVLLCAPGTDAFHYSATKSGFQDRFFYSMKLKECNLI